ncbi:MAG: DUF2771 domain-containing protein [Actinomycetota bacterium]|nr:DUF2771 domain-containing protein [Actinomycetota bacterium]
MKRGVAVLAAVALVASIGTTALVWRMSGSHGPQLPEISAYSQGHLARVGPYRFCQVLNPTDCVVPAEQGEVPVTGSAPVQLSVPAEVGRAPWVLLRAFEDGDRVDEFRPGSRRAVTIPTVDPQLGRLTGLAVQLPTLVRDEQGNEFPVPHAEWSVRTAWEDAEAWDYPAAE